MNFADTFVIAFLRQITDFMDKSNIRTNTDTGLIKIIAFATMLIDHVGAVLFPMYPIFRYVGRIAFPLFAYCLVLGFIYTKDLKKYALRLFVFGTISQIPYYFCFFSHTDFFFQLNIGFTMLLGLYAIWGIKTKKYYHSALALILSAVLPFEYGIYGLCVILSMYIFISFKKRYFALCVGFCLSSQIVSLFLDGLFYSQVLSVAALPIILINTNSKIKIPKVIGYGFYPFHIFVLWIINSFIFS